MIATIAIGADYLKSWMKHAFPTWKKYCERHGLGLIVFDADLIPKSSKIWKKPTWQKLLIGETLKRELPDVRNVCFLDSDILANYMAPNVFDFYRSGTIGLVSLRKNLPYPYDQVMRRLAFLRHTLYDKKYPLDSALFISLDRLYGYHGLAPQADEACMGFFVFNVSEHAEMMSHWFAKYDRNMETITGGGDQTHFNFEAQNWGNVSWMDYRFQAIWVFEMAWKYPFLYGYSRKNRALIRECIEASLSTNYFLHFAGSWHESDMWTVGGVFEASGKRRQLEDFHEYEKLRLTGEPVGQVTKEKAVGGK